MSNSSCVSEDGFVPVARTFNPNFPDSFRELHREFKPVEPTNLPAPLMPEVHVNAAGGRQSFLLARFDYIPPECLLLLAQCVGFGGMKYGVDNWRNIPIEENIGHAMNHLAQFRAGDTSEPHLVNAFTRCCFALSQAVRSGIQGREYNHPQMAEVLAKFADSAKPAKSEPAAVSQVGVQ